MEFAAAPLNKKLLELEGNISEEDARYYLYLFLRNNISFAAELFLGVKLFPFQSLAVKGMMVSDYSMFVFSRGMSKCPKEDEIVFTDSGMKKVIDVKVGDKIQSLHGQNLVQDKIVNPKQKTWRVLTKAGYKSGGLDYHRSLVFNPETLDYDWRFSKDIKVGEIIPIRRGFEFWPEENPIFFKDAEVDVKSKFKFDPTKRSVDDWYYFFGLLIGDGHFRGRKNEKVGVGFTSGDEELAVWVNDFVKDVCLEERVYPKKDSKGLYGIHFARKKMLSWMIKLGFDPNKTAHQKTIPQGLLNNSRKNISALLSGLFDADGYFSTQKNKKKNSVSTHVGFTSCSEELIQQVHNLLLNFGISACKKVAFKGGSSTFSNGCVHQCKKAWSIVVCNSTSCRLFSKKIGFRLSRKKDGLESGFAEQTHGNMDYSSKIPCQKYIESKYGRYHNKNGDVVKLSYGSASLSRPKLQRLYDMGVFDEEDEAKIAKILSLDIYYDTVKAVENEDAVTVDIQVEKEECYYTNGFISHNTYSTAIYILLECILSPKANIGVIAGSFRQCCKYNVIVNTSKGFKEIKDLEIGDCVRSIRGFNKVTDKWKNESAKSLKITTKRGYQFEGKIGHKVYYYNPETAKHEWIEIEKLREKNHLPIQRNINLWGERRIDDDLAYLYGIILGDGSISRAGKKEFGNRATITSNDEETLDFLKKYDFTISKKEGRCFQARSKVNSFLLDEDLICRQTATNKYFPQGILDAESISVGHFLSGLFDADGYCTNVEVALATSSREIAEKTQLMLLNFGIISKLSTEKARGAMKICGVNCIGREAYKVRITGSENIQLFKEKIGFRLARKKEKLEILLKTAKSGILGHVPLLGQFIVRNFPESKLRSIPRGPQSLNINFVKAFLKDNLDLKSEELNFISEQNFYYDEIVSIEESECVTYDITVEKEHCYNAQGFLHHNSKMIFQKMEDILSKPEAKLASDCGVKITKGTDMWTLTVGNGRAIALPLANGERLRGFRFNRIVLDEFITIPEKIFTEVILPFLGVIENPVEREEMHQLESRLIEQGLMKEEERYVWPNNKLIILSSPSFKFEYMYRLYKKYESLIFKEDFSQINEEEDDDLSDNAYRLVMQLSYDCAPKRLYDQNLLKQAKATMSEMQFTREFGAQFVDESDGYFRLSKMAACTIQDGDFPAVEVVGNPSEEYVVAFDPNWSGNSSADHFALHVFKIDKESQKGCLIHSYAIAGVDLKEHMFYFHYVLTHFNVVGICGDYNGGVQFIQSCNESQLFKDSKIFINVMDVALDKPEDYAKDLLEFKNQYNRKERRYCILRKPSSNWIREANEMLQAAIDHKRILFGARATDSHFDEQRKKNIPVENLKWDLGTTRSSKAAMMIDFVDHQKTIIELTKNECANIEVISNPQGSQSFQLPQNFKRQKGPNRARKDSYSALVLGNWFLKIFFDANAAKAPKKTQSTFTPFAI